MAAGRPYRSETLKRWTRNRVATMLAVFALLLQTGIATANGATFTVEAPDGTQQVRMICSTYGAMPAEGNKAGGMVHMPGTDAASMGKAAANGTGDTGQTGDSSASCPICQAHATGKLAVTQAAMTLPGPVKAAFARLGVPTAQRPDGKAVAFVTTRAPPAA